MITCPHGYARPTQCTDCMLDGPVVEPPKPVTWTETEYVRTANYPARCSGTGCGEPVVASVDRIRLWTSSDDETVWLHDGCTR